MTFLETAAALIILRCDQFLKQRGQADSLDRFPALSAFVSRLREKDLERWSFVTDEEVLSRNDMELNISEERYMKLFKALGSDPLLETLLDLGMAVFILPEFSAYLTAYFGYSVCLHLCFLLEGKDTPDEREVLKLVPKAGMICSIDRTASPLRYYELLMDGRVFAYLSGADSLNPVLSDFTEIFRCDGENDLHEPFLNGEEIEKAAEFLRDGGKVLQLCGRGGRRFAAKHAALKAGRDFLFLNIADLFSGSDREKLCGLRDALIREAFFYGAGICFYGITRDFILGREREKSNRRTRDLLMLERLLFGPFISRDIPLILISDEPVILVKSCSFKEYMLSELPERPSFDERTKMWEGLLALNSIKADPKDYALKYQMNASEASGILRSFSERREGASPVPDEKDEMLFNRICIEEIGGQEGGDTGRVSFPVTKLDDVKIKPETRAILDDVVNSVRTGYILLDGWGLRDNYQYGRCVSLLLSGPPGTGKTMTANAIAGELGLPLYQINISNVVDKYIGETEKNLEKAFSYAEKTNTVLFFDEADSIFGVRSEVHDSRDRYANTEISYLLQRIEAYDGIVIMATNIKGNIDPAFIRRIRYVAHFENPDAKIRREIWESCLTDSVPRGDIDTVYLSEQFDKFTGSVIKTVFLNACAYAAGKGDKLEMVHIIHAVKQELEKTSTVSFAMDSLGKYAYLG